MRSGAVHVPGRRGARRVPGHVLLQTPPGGRRHRMTKGAGVASRTQPRPLRRRQDAVVMTPSSMTNTESTRVAKNALLRQSRLTWTGRQRNQDKE